jgi:hypothetical protein
MSTTNFQSNKMRGALLICALLLIGGVVWIVGKYRDVAPTNSDVSRSHSTPTSDVQLNGLNPKSKPNADTLDNTAAKVNGTSLSTVPASKSLAWMQNMMELLQQAPRADNFPTRSFAVYMPSILCTSLLTARGLGPSSLQEDIPAKRILHNERGLERITQRCAEYKGLGVDKLRGPVIASLKAEKAPLTAFFDAKDKSSDAARAQLTQALTDYDATALQPLAIIWPFQNTERIAATLPEELKPYAQGITAAAFDVALCRAGAYCGADSIALDMVCAKFAECDATNVEDAYRRLHNAAGISFAETSRIADGIRDAIQRRDAAALWPDTAKFPSTRK